MKNTEKKSQLVFEPKMARRLLKMNNEIRFCPFCGKSIAENCECHKNIVIDIKPYRGEDNVIVQDRSVLVFDNNSSFQADYSQMIEEAKAKKEAEEPEQIELCFD